MEELLLLLSPLAVSFISTRLKDLGKLKLKKNRKMLVRFIVAVLSFGAAIGTAALTGDPLPVIEVETFVTALAVFFGSTGVYYFTKKVDPKKKK